MSDEQIKQHFHIIRQRSAPLQKQDPAAWEDINAALEDLHVIYEEMQTDLEAAAVVEEGLQQQNQRIVAGYQHYYELFHTSQVAHLITDGNGLILQANQAIAQLLNVPQPYLLGKPLSVYVAEADRSTFRTRLNQLAYSSDTQTWPLHLCPRKREPFIAELHVGILAASANPADRSASGTIESLRIDVYPISQTQQRTAHPTQEQPAGERVRVQEPPSLPDALDGLQVLVVDDEADVREFITAVLESHGIRVTAVATTAAALEALESLHPDVLISDIRLPGDDGYSLIRKVRELEVRQGWHLPSAALTAYLDESQEKVLIAGFEAHLHKLAQPAELVKLVVELAGRRREI